VTPPDRSVFAFGGRAYLPILKMKKRGHQGAALMFYYLQCWANDVWAGLAVFRSVSLRAAFAAVTAFMLCVVFGRPVIAFLRKKKVQENVAKKDSEFLAERHSVKSGTPTMGGIILLGATLIAMLLWCRLDIVFMPLCFFTMLALGLVGFYDDYIKLTHAKADGLTRREKLFYQFLIGGGAGLCLTWYGQPNIATTVVIPFTDASWWPVLGLGFVAWAGFVVAGTSNAVNLTDGLDGLATLCVTSVAVAFGLLAYFAGHAGIAEHLAMPRVRGAEELAIVCAALSGACLGFLWFNAYPAEVFMGDTGSLPLGGLVGLVALCIKQELMLIIIGGVFVAEAMSVLIQIYSCKFFGKRPFRLAPLHHHFEKVGWSETKIVARFFIVSVLLAVFSVAALRIR
jgi:phospho-N-acetylmuramoyl-pentapeptide-transferase